MDIRQKAVVAGEVYEKWIKGDSIGDSELDTAIGVFRGLVDVLYPLSPVFRLAAVECNRCLVALEGFQKARRKRTD